MAKLSIAYLESLTIKEIYALAKEHKITYYSKLTKRELIFALLKSNAEKEGFFFMEGVLEIIPNEGFGFYALSTIHLVRKIFTSLLPKLDVSS